MPVTDEQIATLRAQLRGNIVEHRRLLKQLDADEANVGYPALIAAAFITAVQQRFIKTDNLQTGQRWSISYRVRERNTTKRQTSSAQRSPRE